MNKLVPNWSVPTGSQSVPLVSELTPEEKRTRNMAILIALLVHLALVYVVFPKTSPPIIDPQPPDQPIRPIIVPPEPDPVKPWDQEVIHPRIPVPDPTPEDVEPIVPIVINDANDKPVAPWIPEGALKPPPIEDEEFLQGQKGLVNPLYDMAALQRSVRYPPLGVSSGLEGFVVVEMVLRKEGTVDHARVTGGSLKDFQWFCNAAVDAVRKMTFTPGQWNGNPVDVRLSVTIHFKLNR